MPIDRANRPYDPQDRRQREIDPAPIPSTLPPLKPPPKPGISVGLLAWTLAGAAITFTTIIVLVLVHW